MYLNAKLFRYSFIFWYCALFMLEMEWLKSPFKGIISDIRGRSQCYKDDWTCAFRSGIG